MHLGAAVHVRKASSMHHACMHGDGHDLQERVELKAQGSEL